MLENAFDDVSFDNDDGSLCNGSQNYTNCVISSNNNSHSDIEMNETPKRILTDCDKTILSNVNSHLNHSKDNQIKRDEFLGYGRNFSEPYKKKVLNGSLHDLVDASGGGNGDPQLQSPHFKHCFQRNSLGNCVIFICFFFSNF